MRIGIYDPYLDDLGGGEKYMMTIAECLSKKHQVSVFWDNKKDIDTLLERFSIDLSSINIVPNIFSPTYSRLKRLAKTKDYDILILLSDGSIPVTLSKKTFLHIQQPLPFVSPSLKNRVKLKKINAVFCNSKFTKSFVDKEFNINSLVLYPPVDIKAKNIKKENIILNVGRFRVRDVTTLLNGKRVGVGDYKKQGLLVDVFKHMIKRGLTNWKLIIATSVRDEEFQIFEQLKKNAEGFPIEFLLNKSNDELWETYSRAKIYWHASGFGENLEMHPEFAEHFGISTVEAMGAGCVPVVINAGGQKEIVSDGEDGFLFNTEKELLDKTTKLIRDKRLIETISVKAIAKSQLFTTNKFCSNINSLIR